MHERSNMTLKEIVIKSANILGIDEIDFENPSSNLSKLIDSAKMIFSEISLERLALKTKENISLVGGKGRYVDLAFPVREILKIKHGGKFYSVKEYPDFFEIEGDISGTVEVHYLYYLPDATLDEKLPLPPSLSPYVVATGVVSEYYYRSGMVDEALFYKTRFDYSILNVSRTLRSIYLPRRPLV